MVHWLLIAFGVHFFCLNLVGFSFPLWCFSHPVAEITKPITVADMNKPPHYRTGQTGRKWFANRIPAAPFYRLCSIFLQVITVVHCFHIPIFWWNLQNGKKPNRPVVRFQSFQAGGSRFRFPSHLISILMCVCTEKKSSKAEEKPKSVRCLGHAASANKDIMRVREWLMEGTSCWSEIGSEWLSVRVRES